MSCQRNKAIVPICSSVYQLLTRGEAANWPAYFMMKLTAIKDGKDNTSANLEYWLGCPIVDSGVLNPLLFTIIVEFSLKIRFVHYPPVHLLFKI